MAREVNPKDTTRAAAYELWMKAPNPMVTFFKTVDVTNLVRISKKRDLKFKSLFFVEFQLLQALRLRPNIQPYNRNMEALLQSFSVHVEVFAAGRPTDDFKSIDCKMLKSIFRDLC